MTQVILRVIISNTYPMWHSNRNLSMKDYLLKMKSNCDTLAACGRLVPKEDQVLSILAGLGPEFEPTIVVLTSRIDSYNFQIVKVLLLASENRVLRQVATVETPMSSNTQKVLKTQLWHQFISRNGRG